MSNTFEEQLRRNHKVYVDGYQDHGKILAERNRFVQAARGRMSQEEFDLTLSQIGADILQVRGLLAEVAYQGRKLAYHKSTREDGK